MPRSNIKGDPPNPRIVQVIPIAQGRHDMPQAALSPSSSDLLIELAGGSYLGVAQRANFTMACDPTQTEVEPPTEYIYDNNVLSITWKTAAACPADPNAPGHADAGAGGRMSGAAIFFLVLFLIAITYCVIGSAYNYTILRTHRFPHVLPNWNIWERLLGSIIDIIGSVYDRFSGRYVRL
ncbi:hypothetical protein SeMB42_g05054 [Synchytrium endobioticum]|uniref:Uncharacterized protein n=1 Tax=Synchytrium endobioticum TaxID=286115 RepID=A0A507CU73_9FUNG|nr:hypothetical protein SeLEV6574_g06114 [Synchytrium endobioticum]TPX42620.1 hypothetical protein SeMB42_g05054 [Synchytrium endobioticum]